MEFCQENTLVIANTLFQQHKRWPYTWTSPDGQYQSQIDYILCSWRWRSCIQSAKTRPGADCGSDHELLIAKFSSVIQSYTTLCNSMDAACQASLTITNSQSLLKLMSIELAMPSNHLILCCPLLLPPSIFPGIGSFPVSQFFTSGGQSIGASASASVLPMNIQDWFPLEWAVWVSLLFKGLLRVFSNTTVQKHQFFSAQLSL